MLICIHMSPFNMQYRIQLCNLCYLFVFNKQILMSAVRTVMSAMIMLIVTTLKEGITALASLVILAMEKHVVSFVDLCPAVKYCNK